MKVDFTAVELDEVGRLHAPHYMTCVMHDVQFCEFRLVSNVEPLHVAFSCYAKLGFPRCTLH